jgi:hypothetical protein
VTPLDVTSRPELLRWLAAVTDQIEDMFAAAMDATNRPRRRTLSRYEARRMVKEARKALGECMDAAFLGIGEKSPIDEEAPVSDRWPAGSRSHDEEEGGPPSV